MPMREVQTIYEQYKDATSTINKTKDSFFDEVDKMKFEDTDSIFDTGEDIDDLLKL